jgi:hypothetical protein
MINMLQLSPAQKSPRFDKRERTRMRESGYGGERE